MARKSNPKVRKSFNTRYGPVSFTAHAKTPQRKKGKVVGITTKTIQTRSGPVTFTVKKRAKSAARRAAIAYRARDAYGRLLPVYR